MQPLAKDKAEGPSHPFRFDVLTQLANISTKITLHELLKLLKTTQEALREALAAAKVFVTHVEAKLLLEEPEILQISSNSTCISFSLKDMQVKY